mmetsp:Transcript_15116/g.41791  ORF Transcript_15116/g.41791 Transcript_15116/m.41791 type:complete len:569 (+) Transcript_15116:97-1803(+)
MRAIDSENSKRRRVMCCHLCQFKRTVSLVVGAILMLHTCARLDGLHQVMSAVTNEHASFLNTFYRNSEASNLLRPPQRLRRIANESVQPTYDYAVFWQDALTDALANNRTLTDDGKWDHSPNQLECPKVYIYNLSSRFQDVDAHKIANRQYVFGSAEEGWNSTLWQTIQHHIGVILHHRLQLPGNCYATEDPAQADLFFVPLLLKSKKASDWVRKCQQLEGKSIDDLLAELTFLNESTACQHFFVFPKGHYSSDHCKSWFYDPLPIFNHSLRLAYSHVPGKAEDEDLMYFRERSKTPQIDALHHPHLTSVPYPSNLHHWGTGEIPQNSSVAYNSTIPWDEVNHANGTETNDTMTWHESNQADRISPNLTMPWDETNHADRTVLMSFVGRFDHGDVPVRQQIQKQCQGIYQDPSICSVPSDIQRRSSLPSQGILIKGKSIFCLEPAGDSPWRKSISDSITFGCIPVLFHEMTDDVAPWHWGHWKKQGRVLVDRQAFVEGRIDLYSLLSTIPPQLQTLMQQTLSRFARQFQYSLTDDPGRDGIHTILEGLRNEMLESKRQGLCRSKNVVD